MRVTKAKNIKRGMSIVWPLEGSFTEGVVKGVSLFPEFGKIRVKIDEGYFHLLDYNCDVVVFLEAPKIIQPPELTSFGACVTVNYLYFVRYMIGHSGPSWSGDDNSVADWAELCSMVQVKIVNEDPFSGLEQ